jgi:hypothetical protein
MLWPGDHLDQLFHAMAEIESTDNNARRNNNDIGYRAGERWAELTFDGGDEDELRNLFLNRRIGRD